MPSQALFASEHLDIILIDQGKDIPEEDCDKIGDTIDKWMESTRNGLEEELKFLYPEYRAEVRHRV